MKSNTIKNQIFLLLFVMGSFLQNVIAQGVLHVSNGATISGQAGGFITLQNSKLTNHGNINLQESSLNFTGNLPKTSQLIEGTGNTMMGYIQMNKSLGDIQLKKSITVNRVLSLASGGIEMISGNIELGTTGVLQLENASNRIYGAGGEIKTTQVLGAPIAFNPSNLGAVITSNIVMGNTQINRGHASYLVNGQNSILRYFKILPTNNSSLNATLRLNYFDGELNAVNESNMQIWYSLDNGITWIQTKAKQRDATANFIETDKLNQLAWFTIAPPCSPFLTNLTRYVSLDSFYFFKGQNRKTTGVYIDSLLTKIGCDSIVTLNLFMKPMITLEIKDTIVRGTGYFTLNGKTYTTNQIVNDTIRGAISDSIRRYNVIINIPKIIPSKIVECTNSYIWRGRKLSANGNYRDTILQKFTDTIYDMALTLQGMDLSVSYFNGEFISNCTICKRFQWYLCHSNGTKTKIGNATSRTLKTNTEGEYSVEVDGVEGCTGFSSCVNKITASILSNNGLKILAYPNPFRDNVHIVLEKIYRNADVTLYDMNGKSVFHTIYNDTQEFSMDMNDFAIGVYQLKIFDGETHHSIIKLIKE